jgi:hypothetical protein
MGVLYQARCCKLITAAAVAGAQVETAVPWIMQFQTQASGARRAAGYADLIKMVPNSNTDCIKTEKKTTPALDFA